MNKATQTAGIALAVILLTAYFIQTPSENPLARREFNQHAGTVSSCYEKSAKQLQDAGELFKEKPDLTCSRARSIQQDYAPLADECIQNLQEGLDYLNQHQDDFTPKHYESYVTIFNRGITYFTKTKDEIQEKVDSVCYLSLTVYCLFLSDFGV